MALTTCPHCGKSISDTVTVCIHCDREIAYQKENEADALTLYSCLSAGEQIQLEKEFIAKDEKYKRVYAYQKDYMKPVFVGALYIFALSLLFGVFPQFIGSFYCSSDWFYECFFLFLITFFACQIFISISFRRRQRAKQHFKNWLLLLKKYQKWLREDKKIEYALPDYYIQRTQLDFMEIDPETPIT